MKTSGSIPIRISPLLLEDFKELTQSSHGLKYNIVLEQFLFYANYPDLNKIFKFYDISYMSTDQLDENGKKVSVSRNIFVKDLERTSIPNHFPYKQSSYIQTFMAFYVLNNKKFLELFQLKLSIPYTENDNNNYLKLVPNDITRLSEYNSLLMQDFEILSNLISETEEKLKEELMLMFYSDFRFENDLVNEYPNQKYSDLSEDEKFIIYFEKIDFKESNYLNIALLDIKFMKLISIYIYKSVELNMNKNMYTKYKENLEAQYIIYLAKYNDDIEFQKFILAVIYNDNELLRLALAGRIDFSSKISKYL